MKLNPKKTILIVVVVGLIMAIGFVGVRLLSTPVSTPPPPAPPETKLKQVTYQLRVPEEITPTVAAQQPTSAPNPTSAVVTPTTVPSPTLLAQAATPTPTVATATPTITQILTSPTITATASAQAAAPEAGMFQYTIAFFLLAIALVAFSFAL